MILKIMTRRSIDDPEPNEVRPYLMFDNLTSVCASVVKLGWRPVETGTTRIHIINRNHIEDIHDLRYTDCVFAPDPQEIATEGVSVYNYPDFRAYRVFCKNVDGEENIFYFNTDGYIMNDAGVTVEALNSMVLL